VTHYAASIAFLLPLVPRIAVLLALAVAGCAPTGSTELHPVCDVDLTDPGLSGAPGDAVTLTASPLSEAYDTIVLVGGARAEVTAVSRDGCDACDTCRSEEDCGSCGACSTCDAVCDACVETATFLVPDLAPGPAPLVLVNRLGQSATWTFEVLPAAADSDTPADTDAPAETDTPADTDAPVDTDTPVDTDAPADSDTPVDTDAPADSDTPVDTDAPADSSAPPDTDTPP
jgi:hypothetical protein